ncbi:uncharacterized protein Z519_06374 [Cladophialophora bantiana CBS 173.52]|uniref:HpcH/HpaI aldolase/citrate lyase domain-containing protein n=1 Tax=Cladophialophora bantiana (strain ATCC 10958 / CBS 173.52 / CDC B-1940 / NIH 8579) TaxID=1442370 RepID=A0A0D2G1E0_CLAB1|nr:uncharacterized protein Z519_06374 [Cladophialophora bantiana CBS 173.52]KIW92527.1 hypothetical protein Z519_06374 [Cladophialophora bantiana CBS 173.52]
MAPFVDTLRARGPLVGTFVTLTSPLSAAIVGAAGYDCVIIDMEHVPTSALEATHIVHTMGSASKGTCMPLVRVPSHGVEWIKWGLDSGAAGIVVPMVNTPEEARQIVQRARYPPLGQRSYGPAYAPFADPASDRSASQYFNSTAQGLAVLPMIESATGVENADAILATEGVSGAFVGPFDLRCSLGLPGGDGKEDRFLDALKRIAAAAKNAGKPVGIYTGSKEQMARNLSLGFEYILYQGDSSLLANAVKASVEEARSVIKQVKSS